MKDYKAIALARVQRIAKAYLGRNEELVLEDPETRALFDADVAELAAELQAAYDDGVLSQQTEAKEPPQPEVLVRREDELLRKTEKILGSEARTHKALLLKPHKLRAVATYARVDPRVFRDFLSGQRTPERVASMIRRTLRQLGYPIEPGAPS